MTRTCQEDLLHIGDNGDLVEAPEGQTCPNGDFGGEGHCLCQKGERVSRLETLFDETSTDRILILHCQQIAFRLKVNTSLLPSLPFSHSFQFYILLLKVFGDKWMSKTMETEVVKPFEWDEIPKTHNINKYK